MHLSAANNISIDERVERLVRGAAMKTIKSGNMGFMSGLSGQAVFENELERCTVEGMANGNLSGLSHTQFNNELGGWLRKLKKAVKRGGKMVGRSVKRVAKKVGKVIKKVAPIAAAGAAIFFGGPYIAKGVSALWGKVTAGKAVGAAKSPWMKSAVNKVLGKKGDTKSAVSDIRDQGAEGSEKLMGAAGGTMNQIALMIARRMTQSEGLALQSQEAQAILEQQIANEQELLRRQGARPRSARDTFPSQRRGYGEREDVKQSETADVLKKVLPIAAAGGLLLTLLG